MNDSQERAAARRRFMQQGIAVGLGAASVSATPGAIAADSHGAGGARSFKLKYAPHFGMFKNHAKSLEDQLQFAADEGFRAWEDNGMNRRDEATQRKLAEKMEQLGMQMGVFVAHGDFGKPTFASGRKDHQERVLADIDKACVVADRVRAGTFVVISQRLADRAARAGAADTHLAPGPGNDALLTAIRRLSIPESPDAGPGAAAALDGHRRR